MDPSVASLVFLRSPTLLAPKGTPGGESILRKSSLFQCGLHLFDMLCVFWCVACFYKIPTLLAHSRVAQDSPGTTQYPSFQSGFNIFKIWYVLFVFALFNETPTLLAHPRVTQDDPKSSFGRPRRCTAPDTRSLAPQCLSLFLNFSQFLSNI